MIRPGLASVIEHNPSVMGSDTPDEGSAVGREGAAVAFERAAAQLGGRTIWSDLSLSVAGGEFVAVLGPNGAGKSTLIKAVLGLLPLAGGRASVLGRPPGAANHQIGYLPQRRSFDAGTRIRGVDIVRLGLDGARWGFPIPGLPSRAREAVRVAEVIELVDASAYARKPIGELSGGEQQRLLIAQALVRRPRLLLLDEPLDSLDLPNQAAVAALVRRICREENVAVMLVAHDINPILSYLDRVVYIAAGAAVEGRPEQVISSETLSRLYGSPIEVLRASDGRLVVVGQPEAPFVHGDRHAHG
ncbi:MAG: zinc/manganese transport system ATP-binding protein [Gaiellales bacterium]|nr:zinc/manganese transport system ATP-binding protein [Gaiellales bacterium]